MDTGVRGKKEDNKPRVSVIDSQLLASLEGSLSLLAGVVTALEVREDHKQTIVTVDVGEDEKLVLLVQNSAGAFLGRIVLIDGGAKRIYHNSDQRFGFAILNCLSIPPDLTSKGIKLPKLLSVAGGRQVRQTFRPKAEVERDRLLRIFRSSDSDRLTATQVIRLIPQMYGRERSSAERMAAEKIVLHAEKTGDCALAARLVEAVHHSKRDRLCAWFEEYSPISVTRKKRPYKARIKKDNEGARKSFQLERARRNPF